MRQWLSNRIGSDNDNLKWFYLRLSMIVICLPVLFIMIYQSKFCPLPIGICKYIDFTLLFTFYGKILLYLLLIVGSVFYIREQYMLYTTAVLFLLSCIIISFHESNGIFFRATVLSMLWFAQFLAYFIHSFRSDFNLKHYRVQFCVQIVAATYTLAAIAKLKGGGMDWINAGELFSVQVIKNHSFLYFDSGVKEVMEHGRSIAYTLIHNKTIIKFMLTTSLLLELFCFLATFNARWRIFFGIGLLAMHIGIAMVMGIGVGIIAKPLVVFFINPLYWIHILVGKLAVSKVSV